MLWVTVKSDGLSIFRKSQGAEFSQQNLNLLCLLNYFLIEKRQKNKILASILR